MHGERGGKSRSCWARTPRGSCPRYIAACFRRQLALEAGLFTGPVNMPPWQSPRPREDRLTLCSAGRGGGQDSGYEWKWLSWGWANWVFPEVRFVVWGVGLVLQVSLRYVLGTVREVRVLTFFDFGCCHRCTQTTWKARDDELLVARNSGQDNSLIPSRPDESLPGQLPAHLTHAGG